MQLLLASNSPRRRQLLSLGGWVFTAVSADVDESPYPGERPLDYVLRLAEAKARAAAAGAPPGSVVLAADTTVVDTRLVNGDLEQSILGKPGSPAEAEAMLRRLRGRVHQVYTGISAFRPLDGTLLDEILLTDWCLTDVPMRNYTEEEMAAYIASGDPLDKAGGYAIQHRGFHPVEGLLGCYANVVGLPLCHVARLLGKLGVEPQASATLVCRSALPHDCQISEQVLKGL